MKLNRSEISVIMSCYNEESKVTQAVESIINQTFRQFEFIIVNDGSTDKTHEILEGFESTDNRIKLIHNPRNIGLAASLNIGIEQSKAQFIARMDADDIALPERLEKQYEFMLNHSQIDILGTAIFIRNTKRKHSEVKTCPQYHSQITERVFKKPLVFHPTVMIRRRVFENYGTYDPALKWAEDADLWYRIYDRVHFHNLQEPLLYYSLKDKLSIKNAILNWKVKFRNLKRRNSVFNYLPQLVYDLFLLSSKVTFYRF